MNGIALYKFAIYFADIDLYLSRLDGSGPLAVTLDDAQLFSKKDAADAVARTYPISKVVPIKVSALHHLACVT